MAKVAVYPGSFDPVTNGHLDIVARACKIFDRVIVAVLENPAKRYTFSKQERLGLLREALKGKKGVEVDSFSGLLVDYLRRKGVRMVIRGLRAVSDLDYEFQLASVNRRLLGDIETVFLMPAERHTYLSASIVREIALMGADVSSLVPPAVARALRARSQAK